MKILGEDIDWWHFVVKIQRQWDDLIWARHDNQRINEISRLCWRPNTSRVLFATLLLCKGIGLSSILISCTMSKYVILKETLELKGPWSPETVKSLGFEEGEGV